MEHKTVTLKLSLFSMLICFSLLSCEKLFMDTAKKDSPLQTYDDLWKVLDEKYSYFGYKNINWDSIGMLYRKKLTPYSSQLQLYYICQDLLYELKDGHVNLFVGFDYSRYWKWYLDSPQNFNYTIVERYYLGEKHWTSGGIKSSFLADNKVGYMRYSSFNGSIIYFPMLMERFEECKGVIIDIRDNGGGSLDNAKMLACYIADKERLALKTYYKKSAKHNDFTSPEIYNIKPINKIYTKPVVILTNRMCFSAASFFVAMAQNIPNVIILGDRTGGGAGLPSDYMLSNGWRVRFSTTRSVDANEEEFEFGTDPHIFCDMDMNLSKKNIDSIIETAIDIILEKS